MATAEFYSGSDFKGSFGIGENFFESQRNGGFFSKSAAPSEVRRFLDLLEPVGADVERGRILDGDFKPMRSVELVPLQVKAAFAGLTKESGFEMADPGQDFQLTDVIVQGKAPLAENDSLPEYLTRRASCTMKGVAEDTRITWLSSLQIRPERCSFGVVHYPSLRQRSRNSDS